MKKIASTAAFTTTDESITTVETPSIANAIKTAITTTPPAPTNEELTANTEFTFTTT